MKRPVLLVIILTVVMATLSMTAVEAQGSKKEYIVISRSQFGVPSAVLQQIRAAGGTIVDNYARMGLVVASSTNPNFTRSISAARAVVPNMKIATAHPQVVLGPSVGTAKVVNPPNTGDDDFFFDFQWGIAAVDAKGAWAQGRRGAGAIVAVLDEGVDADHPDLAGQVRADLSTSFAEDGAGGIEDWNPPPGFYFNHGTHVAGIVAAADNAFGVIGVAPSAKIMAVDVLSRELGYGEDSWILKGIMYAADHGADIINMSLGSGPLDSRGACDKFGCYTHEDILNLFLAYSYAALYANSKGTTVIASAGNEGFDFGANPLWVHLPSDALGILSISATAPIGWAVDPTVFLDNPASYSNFGRDRIDFSAPGGDAQYPGDEDCTVAGDIDPCWVFDLVFSDIPGGWAWAGGTSMAAPHAAGVAAQYIGAAGGSLPPALVEAGLRYLADHPNTNPHRDPFYGYGRVDSTPPDPSP